MRGNSSVDLEREIIYGRNKSDPPAGPPLPEPGGKCVVFGFVLGIAVGGAAGGLLGTVLHLGSIFLTVAAGAFVGGFIGTLGGDRFKKRRRKKRGAGGEPPLSAA